METSFDKLDGLYARYTFALRKRAVKAIPSNRGYSSKPNMTTSLARPNSGGPRELYTLSNPVHAVRNGTF